VTIVDAGCGIRLDAGVRHTEDLLRIAAAAKASGARVIFSGMSVRQTADLTLIGAAGGGRVLIED